MSSKSKGSGFERDCAKLLTIWLTGQEKPYAIWRTPNSGGLCSTNELNKDLSGDLVALRPEAVDLLSKFSIECKAGYKDATLDNFFKNTKALGYRHLLHWGVKCIHGVD